MEKVSLHWDVNLLTQTLESWNPSVHIPHISILHFRSKNLMRNKKVLMRWWEMERGREELEKSSKHFQRGRVEGLDPTWLDPTMPKSGVESNFSNLVKSHNYYWYLLLLNIISEDSQSGNLYSKYKQSNLKTYQGYTIHDKLSKLIQSVSLYLSYSNNNMKTMIRNWWPKS